MGLGAPKILYEKYTFGSGSGLDTIWSPPNSCIYDSNSMFLHPGGPHILLDPLEQTFPCVLTGLQPYQLFEDLAFLPGIGSGW